MQLEAYTGGIDSDRSNTFQFHIGAIRSGAGRGKKPDGSVEFQFHIGAIRSSASFSGSIITASFNSILVQLEGRVSWIRAKRGSCFNSILVQLEACRGSLRPMLRLVSIPYWCN